jgi:Holliday junction DNA helicase RuvA
MIGYLHGTLNRVSEDSCLIEVGGVGYLVYCSNTTLAQLRERRSNDNESIKLLTRLIHREDILDLYGFLENDEYTLFNMLIKVSGIGPKQALKILGTGKASRIVQAIVADDDSFLMKLSGIGEKKAQQIIFALKERLRRTFEILPADSSTDYTTAVSALESLGFTGIEAKRAVDTVLSSGNDSLEVADIIENALKILSS